MLAPFNHFGSSDTGAVLDADKIHTLSHIAKVNYSLRHYRFAHHKAAVNGINLHCFRIVASRQHRYFVTCRIGIHNKIGPYLRSLFYRQLVVCRVYRCQCVGLAVAPAVADAVVLVERTMKTASRSVDIFFSIWFILLA